MTPNQSAWSIFQSVNLARVIEILKSVLTEDECRWCSDGHISHNKLYVLLFRKIRTSGSKCDTDRVILRH